MNRVFKSLKFTNFIYANYVAMTTITLKLEKNSSSGKRLLRLIKQFENDPSIEIDIHDMEMSFDEKRDYLQSELDEIEQGRASFVGIEEAEQRLNSIMSLI